MVRVGDTRYVDRALSVLVPRDVAESARRSITSLPRDRLLRVAERCVRRITPSERAYLAFLAGDVSETAADPDVLLARMQSPSIDLGDILASFVERCPRALRAFDRAALREILEPVIARDETVPMTLALPMQTPSTDEVLEALLADAKRWLRPSGIAFALFCVAMLQSHLVPSYPLARPIIVARVRPQARPHRAPHPHRSLPAPRIPHIVKAASLPRIEKPTPVEQPHRPPIVRVARAMPQTTAPGWRYTPRSNPYVRETMRPIRAPAHRHLTLPPFLDHARSLVAAYLAARGERFQIVSVSNRDDGSAKIDAELTRKARTLFGVYTVSQDGSIVEETVIPVGGGHR